MLRFLLKPFSVIFLIVTSIRNYLYDEGYLRSFDFTLPVVNVGNLRVGGTGKTPMVEYLAKKLLAEDVRPGIISRGYGRKTKGFRIAGLEDNAQTVGDEPFQYFMNFGEQVPVAVGEDRLMAIPGLLSAVDGVGAIILDDAFQHRRVRAGCNIVLSCFVDPFFDDDLLPGGRLRESAAGLKRADVVIFTKCPENVPVEDQKRFTQKVQECAGNPLPVFFTEVAYGTPESIFGESKELSKNSKVLMVSGIADDSLFEKYIASEFTLVEKVSFPDHHQYTNKDIQLILQKLRTHNNCTLVTTAKDRTKLGAFASELAAFPCYYIPIQVVFLQDEEKFLELLRNTIHQYH